MNEPLLLKNMDFNTSCVYYPSDKAARLYDSSIATNYQHIPCSTHSTLGRSTDSARYRSTPHPPYSTTISNSTPNSWDSGHLISNLPAPILEIDPNSLMLIKPLGIGRFGKINLCQMDGHRPVVVKHLNEDASSQLASEFRLEVATLSRLRHQNVLRVIGVSNVTTSVINDFKNLKNETCCVVEFMPNGDLREFLRRDRVEPIK